VTQRPQRVLGAEASDELAGSVTTFEKRPAIDGDSAVRLPESNHDSAGPSPSDDALPLVLRGVTKRWQKDQPPVLEDVDLTLDMGTRTWVGGRNGAGKTTLLRVAAGLIDPDRGRAQAWGFSARERRSRYQQLIAFLPAGDRGLYARLTVRRQLEFWARIAMMEPARVWPKVDETIEKFELGELAGRRVDRMSMGQRQRLRIAMTFLTEPEVVLLDEPLTSLDAEGAAILGGALDELIARHGALLWCSPSGEHLDQKFDARWVLERGRLERA
jgi:ABC-2 type transport system ATP-binding protein